MPKHKTTFVAATRILSDQPRSSQEAATVKVGAAEMRDATVRMKQLHGGAGVHESLGADGDAARVAVLQGLEATDHTHNRGGSGQIPSVQLETEKEAIVEIAAGGSPRRVEVKYDLHRGFVDHALRRRFGSPEAAKLALQGFVLENALACQVVAATKITEMSGPQAVMSGAILIDKALALEKSIADRPKTIDFGALASMGKTLKVVREIVASKAQKDGA
jgi:hypothetical protein